MTTSYNKKNNKISEQSLLGERYKNLCLDTE
jgi:hypothetical protein